MSRELLLLRHGKSDWDTDASDFDRPLKRRGKKAAYCVGKWLRKQQLVPDLVISSPAARAIRTARVACKTMGLKRSRIMTEDHVYLANPEELIAVLYDCPEQARIMLIGHNPGLEDLMLYLTGGNVVMPDDGKLLPTASIAVLEMPDSWRDLGKGCARLLSLTRPAEML
jgi:phosphohistidine phosphatase